jgi:hypothetical protein
MVKVSLYERLNVQNSDEDLVYLFQINNLNFDLLSYIDEGQGNFDVMVKVLIIKKQSFSFLRVNNCNGNCLFCSFGEKDATLFLEKKINLLPC